jgi:hypothetical protein
VDLLSSKSLANLVQEMRQLGRKLGVLFRGRHEMEKLLPNQIVQGILQSEPLTNGLGSLALLDPYLVKLYRLGVHPSSIPDLLNPYFLREGNWLQAR